MSERTTVYAILNPELPVYHPLPAWKQFLKKYLRIPFKAPYLVYASVNSNFITIHPDNLQVVREIMARTQPHVDVVVKNPVTAVK